MTEITLQWQGPFAFFPEQTLPYLFDQSAAQGRGLYLWTVPTDRGHQVNYVGVAHGKTRTLGARLAEELMDGVPDSRYIQVVDLDAWRKGYRKVLHDYGTFDSNDHKESLIEMHRFCVGFLAQIDADREIIEHCERCLIMRLAAEYDDGDDYDAYLSNKARHPNMRDIQVRSYGEDIWGLPNGVLLNKDGIVLEG